MTGDPILDDPTPTARDPFVEQRTVDPQTLVPYEGNPNIGDVDAVRESLRANGQYRSPVTRVLPDGTLQVLAGHTTRLAAIAEGLPLRVDVVAGPHLWCVYPVPNAFFMHPSRVRRGGLWYAIGCFFGYTVTGSTAREIVRLDDKEDFERSCRFYLTDGEVVRFDSVTMHTRFYKEPGGMQDYRTEETVREGAARLQRMYPQLVTVYRARSGQWEVRLRDRTAKVRT